MNLMLFLSQFSDTKWKGAKDGINDEIIGLTLVFRNDQNIVYIFIDSGPAVYATFATTSILLYFPHL